MKNCTAMRQLPALVLALAFGAGVFGQTPPPVAVLEIEMQNSVNYWYDVADPSQTVTSPDIVRARGRNFLGMILIADIVAVNGKPAKGTTLFRSIQAVLSPNPQPRTAIADIARTGLGDFCLEIHQADGTPVGAIMGLGFSGGPPPPGAPPGATSMNLAVTGGTGAFLGVRGQRMVISAPVAVRQASVSEDPANRRTHGGGTVRNVLHLIPLSWPEIVTTRDGPAIVHSNDFTLVTPAKPARPGELLSLFATGLGPTRPGVASGKPFPASPLEVVNSPVEVTVNGTPAEVLAAVGYPGAVDRYQVNFRLPPDAGRGQATIQLSAAWIPGPEMRMAVQ
ncbi:MAG: hypothetical protein AAB225_31065 [Acidobacteriota bacterium]